ncbi:hypothetical protein [Deinococcus hohokamensis]|uniref:Uncharacterized protein n=1 Tax=Deinococcus hohokamensis TaxID=309883 RepID=A0ABV9IFI0_9DEIO
MTHLIASADLRLEHLPQKEDDWQGFASSFQGYLHWGSFERCADIANNAAKQYHQTGTLPTDLDVLRTCLFFEQRRARHGGFPPDEADKAYTRAIHQVIRDQVARRTGSPE